MARRCYFVLRNTIPYYDIIILVISACQALFSARKIFFRDYPGKIKNMLDKKGGLIIKIILLV